MIKGFKIRIYPTKEQESLIWKHIHASRFIWNYMLDLQNKNFAAGGKFISAFGMNYLLPDIKKQDGFEWLTEVSSQMLKRTCADLADAYQRFFKGTGHPRFKSRKKAKPAFPVRCDNLYFVNGTVNIERVGKLKYKSDIVFPEGRSHKFSNARVTYINGNYMLSFSMRCENQALQLTEESMGIDLGIKELAVVACGNKQYIFHNINKSKKLRNINKRIRHIQRRISRKYEASRKYNDGRYLKTNNICKEEDKLRKLQVRKANIRHNYLHQTTNTLVSMLPKQVIMEDLNVSGMMKNRHLSKAIAEQCFHEFIRQMRYKCEWSGIRFLQADRFYPSSKTCSHCGALKRDLRLKDRAFICPTCGIVIDRDYNAAINLSRYADLPTQAAV